MLQRSLLTSVCLLLCTLLWIGSVNAQTAALPDQLHGLATVAGEGMEAAERNDVTGMQHEYDEIHEAWETFEGTVRDANPAAYVEIEAALDGIKDAIQANPVDKAVVSQAFDHFKDEATELAEKLATNSASAPATVSKEVAAPVEQLRALATVAREGMEAAERNDVAGMQHEYNEIHEAWGTFEGAVRDANPTAYVELESALDKVKDAVQASSVDAGAAGQAFDQLLDKANAVAASWDGTADKAATPTLLSSPSDLFKTLEAVAAKLEAQDAEEAREQFALVIQSWPNVEGAIAARSQDAYEAIEGDLGRVSAALKAQPADVAAATTGVQQLRAALAPFTQDQTYGILDAAAIILREGLEALLVVGALLAFLQRSGNQDKSRWIWLGAAIGIVISIGAAFVLQYLFSQVTAGQNRELIEGITGLVAAGLLLYVSYWLHSKASLREWQKYINTQTTQALARGNMISLALLSFLAIFREGAETAIFYLGMAPSIEMRDLFLGLALGVVALVVIAALMFVAGVRLPLRLFFRVAGLLVYYLGFKFLGTGVHALQVAGAVSISPVAFLKEIPLLGIYPTWETLLPQLALLVIAILIYLYLRMLDQRVQAKGVPSIA